MNKNTSMSYFLNKITDLIRTKVYVENGPLEQPLGGERDVKKDILTKEAEKEEEFVNSQVTDNLVQNIPEEKAKENSLLNVININSSHKSQNLDMQNNFSSEENLKSEFNLLSAEKIVDFEEKINLRIDEYDFDGHAVVTDYKLIFKPNLKSLRQCLKNPFPYYQCDYFDIPLLLISKIEKYMDKKNGNNHVLEIKTKDNRNIKLVNSNESKKFYGDLAYLANPKGADGYSTFAMKYREHHPVNTDGWEVYNLVEEFMRQGVNFSEYDAHEEANYSSVKKVRLSRVNENYQLCPSYPSLIIVPSTIKDEELKEAANFRTKSRIPNMCYYNKENNASLWRSSQTRSGLTYQRNEKDEKLLQTIFELNSANGHMNSNLSSTKINKLIIYDARPYLNAFANRFKGAGFENTDYYKNTEICFCEIDNIHCVRSSLLKIYSIICSPKFIENKQFLSSLENSTWVNFIYQIIKSAVDVANSIKKGNSVLIHCSDGWDRSSQLTSLAQLLLDPYYRTLQGFIVLIEKEWLSFGHQFGLRNGFYNLKDHSEDQRAPIFLQWLDCIHQLLFQFPHIFEFNMDLLLFIANHLNTCKYGTFIYNSEFERNEKGVRTKTVSIWTDVLDNKSLFLNPFYNPETQTEKKFKYLIPNFAFYKIRFWEEHFLRYIQVNNNFDKYYPSNYKRKSPNDNDNFEFFEEIENKKYFKNRNNIKSNVFLTTKKTISSYQFIELQKMKDEQTIKNQKNEIEKLNKIIKEISSKIIFKVADYNELTGEVKNYINKLNNGEVVEEDGYVVVKKSENFK